MPLDMFKPKILVERVLENKEILIKKYPVEQGKIIIRKGRGKVPSYTPPLDPSCIVDEDHCYTWFAPLWNLIFGKHRKVYYIDGADTLTPVTPKGDPPKWSAEPIVKAASVKLLEKQAKTSGQTTTLEVMTLVGIVLVIFMIWVVWTKLGIVNV